MSHSTTTAHSTDSTHGNGHENGHHHYPPEAHVAHHFDTPIQQFDAGKMGIWLFLVTEVLFFSGLFVAYAIFRSHNPEIFTDASRFLNKNLGALNTCVLLFSSLTMAWGVRCAQLSQRRGLIFCLILTIVCAFAFMVVKYFEYTHKFHMGIFPGKNYAYDPAKDHDAHEEDHKAPASDMPTLAPDAPTISTEEYPGATPSETSIQSALDSEKVPRNLGIFFSIYYCMTGLHAIHIIFGIGALSWILMRSIRGDFSAQYFGPVDYVGLYWHLVDLIWIYLFPLLYLIGN